MTKRVFKNSPATLQEFFGSARGIDATFVIYKDEEWSFRDVIEEADKPSYASVYRYGVKVGDRVGTATRNMPEWLIVRRDDVDWWYLGFIERGADRRRARRRHLNHPGETGE